MKILIWYNCNLDARDKKLFQHVIYMELILYKWYEIDFKMTKTKLQWAHKM